MCGINGIYRYTYINDEDIKKIHLMNEEMHYRGPDECGIWNDNKAVIGMVRLSIIGLDNGHQPIFNENKSLAIVCNGEIYNYKELKDNLIKNGHFFSTQSDSEVILHLYEEKGVDCLTDLRGMFAFALWDTEKKQMFIARDRVGKKPLYYSQLTTGVAFSSELNAIQKNLWKEFDFDYSVLDQILRFSYPVELSNTHIKQIKKVEPGEFLLIDDDKGIRQFKYWEKQNKFDFQGTFEDVKVKTLDILKESVQLRLRSDVPIAVLLSGGIDSSAIACIASKNNDNIHAITVGYKGNHNCDERETAKRLCSEKNINWHNLELDVNDYKNYFDEYVSYLDEPVCDIAAIAQWGMYKKCKEEGFTVLLGGNGGDEIFYGYPTHNKNADNMDCFQEIKDYFIQKPKITKWIKYLLRNKEQILDLINTYNPNYFDSIFIKGYKDLNYKWTKNSLRFANYNKYFEKELYSIDKIYSFLFNVWLQSNCLFLSDKLGMAHSLEIRAPFTDHKLIEFVSSLPLEYKYKKGEAKWLLKEVLKDTVPDYILYGPKKGFSPPSANILEIIDKYNSKYFGKKLTTYNSVLIDKFMEQYNV